MSINQLGDKTTGHSIGLAYLSDTIKNWDGVDLNYGIGTFPLTGTQTLLVTRYLTLTQPSALLVTLNVSFYFSSSGSSDSVQIAVSTDPAGASVIASTTIYSQANASCSQSAGLNFVRNGYPTGTATYYVTAFRSATSTAISLIHIDATTIGLPQ